MIPDTLLCNDVRGSIDINVYMISKVAQLANTYSRPFQSAFWLCFGRGIQVFSHPKEGVQLHQEQHNGVQFHY